MIDDPYIIDWLAGLWKHEYQACHQYTREALREGANPWEVLNRFEEVRDAVVYALWDKLQETLT